MSTRSQASLDASSQHDPPPVSSNLLTGTILSSIFYLKDPATDNKTGAFFVFPDLNIRPEGSYKLRFDVFGIRDGRASPLAHCLSAVFTVYSAKRFPGMTNSTELSKTFSDQGLKIRIRKDIRVRKKARLEKSLADDEQDGSSLISSSRAAAPPITGRHSVSSASVADSTRGTQHFHGVAGSAQQLRLQPPVNPGAPFPRESHQAQQHDHDHFRVRHPYNNEYDRYYRNDLQPVTHSRPAPLLTSSSSEREEDGTIYQRLSLDASYPSPRNTYTLAENFDPLTSRYYAERVPPVSRHPLSPMRLTQEDRAWKTPALPKVGASVQQLEEVPPRRDNNNHDQRPQTIAETNRLPSFGEAFAAYDPEMSAHMTGLWPSAAQPAISGIPRVAGQSSHQSDKHKSWNQRP